MVEPVALVALAIDAVVGWPAGLYRRIGHPVGLFARIIDRCEQRWNRADTSPGLRRALGVVTVVLLLMVAAGGGLLLQMALGKLHLRWIGMALLAWPALAQRSLYDHVVPVAQALERSDLNAARQAVGAIVGRDTAALDRRGVARAAIESLAESFCDGIAAPLFWLLVGGLPGIWAYKAINTADSMIGHREERWRAFGWAAARLDDALNLVPARIAALLLCLGGGGGWRILWRDARKHASPNAGWTEAAMAGALGLRLAGQIAYDGVVHHKDWIGSGRAEATAEDLRQALAIYRRACLFLWIIAAVFAVLGGSIVP
ncbi:adenosylcobinamide-phosphate synthase CbiB [uncultured Novosphingobium sp.]|uniref:adenosylcobinamide-phosphate synthase CbiB n=1 Tax=uncultured Novosphingobium sp. TaxID=292277 RepID=UPI0025890226|nr:adenosylcobinamide-phosphate synthase CbiB [uncultured Novosphingobium sp.]